MAKIFVYGLRYTDGPFVYVGSTRKTLKQRLKAHLHKAKSLQHTRASLDFKPIYSWLLATDDVEKVHIVPLIEVRDDGFQRRWSAERAMIDNVSRDTLVNHKLVICNVMFNPFRRHVAGDQSFVDHVNIALMTRVNPDDVATAESAILRHACADAVEEDAKPSLDELAVESQHVALGIGGVC